MAETTFPLAAIVRVMKANGIERVSADAAIAYEKRITDIVISEAKALSKLAAHAGRKTVKVDDIVALDA